MKIVSFTAVPSSRYPRILRVAAVLALIALALIVWSVLDPRPAPVIVAMSIGQAIGALSFGLFLLVVLADLRHMQRADDQNHRKGGRAEESMDRP